ncbi:type II toxin-antitoxin system RelE/ParE family toxin [Paracoccus sp. JM45]|uniref:type II toxin-antitoxin system RelE family toxin n=1 Tax=Paracoccus sp. JM45 TaxID=2283626 RepID=UPI000E6C8048|nr:type II toxin-antitoxin system RelE/ParE family toxin [Paracoccus sp. JM45]RJE78609.1 type II toxin-antitoxin system RelE/ParE family toxin [Paracoccus sp. JM45]
MSYNLRFKEEAKKEWDALGATVRTQFKKALEKRLEEPHIPSARLSGSHNRYKIKLRSAGFRLVYEVRDEVLVVVVIAVGKRDKSAVYRKAEQRL